MNRHTKKNTDQSAETDANKDICVNIGTDMCASKYRHTAVEDTVAACKDTCMLHMIPVQAFGVALFLLTCCNAAHYVSIGFAHYILNRNSVKPSKHTSPHRI